MAVSIAIHSLRRHTLRRSRVLHITRQWQHLARYWLRGAGLVFLSGIVLCGCGSDSTGPGTSTAASLFWSLSLNWRAVNIALTAGHDTVQLTAVPRTSAGALILDADTVHYFATDSSVTVSPTGLVTAHYPTSGTQVIASLTVGNITLADTAMVRVTDTVFTTPLDTLSIQPRPGGLDSAKTAWDSYSPYLPVFAATATDTVCKVTEFDCALLVHFASSDQTVATIDQQGNIDALRPGQVTFYVSTLAYGIEKQDSLHFTLGYAIQTLNNRFQVTLGQTSNGLLPFLSVNKIIMGVGGRVVVANQTGQALEFALPYRTAQIQVVGETRDGSSPVVDTVKNGKGGGKFLQFDSAGRYTVHFTPVSTGRTIDGTIVVRGGP